VNKKSSGDVKTGFNCTSEKFDNASNGLSVYINPNNNPEKMHGFQDSKIGLRGDILS